MDADLQRRVQRYGWDKAASYYEDYWQRQLRPAQDLLMELASLKAGQKVLDTACGTGLVSFRAREITGDTGFVFGTDISEKMVAHCNQVMQEKKLDAMRFERMDAEELALAGEGFDCTLCALGLMYMPAPMSALKEMHRVLKSGGRAVAAVWGLRDHCGWAQIFQKLSTRRVSSEVCPLFFNLGNPGMLSMSFAAAGFVNVEVYTISSLLEYGSAEEACIAAFAGGPVALAYNKFFCLQDSKAKYMQNTCSR